MAKIKLTKGELKKQRDSLRQYERYLPTLQLKKQQLQIEIVRQAMLREEKTRLENAQRKAAEGWCGLLAEPGVDIRPWLKPVEVITSTKNIAGVDVALFDRAAFEDAVYDLFTVPLWVDRAIESLRKLIALREEIRLIEAGIGVLKQELRVTAQRVNLFEKVKIPEAKEAIRLIKIYIGDQLANAVGRSKAAKRKIEEAMLEEAAL